MSSRNPNSFGVRDLTIEHPMIRTGLCFPRLLASSLTSAEGRDSSRPGRAEARPSKPIGGHRPPLELRSRPSQPALARQSNRG